MDAGQQLPVLIIGAGISGLALAQHLRKLRINFKIFERDTSPEARGPGWGLTLNWALPILEEILPSEIYNRLPEVYANKGAVERGEPMVFKIIDYTDGSVKTTVPNTGPMARVNRQRLRTLLADGIDVQWGTTLIDFESDDGSVTAHFKDGTSVKGCLFMACDGVQSRFRPALYPATHELQPISVRMLGMSVQIPPERIGPILEVSKFFFTGGSSKTDAFMYFSFIDCPLSETNPTGSYTAQVCISWPYRAGFFGFDEPLEVPDTPHEIVALMKRLAVDWVDPFGEIVRKIPDNVELREIVCRDWPPPKDEHGHGRVVLMGDATHPMTMFRGEGANHAIADTLDVMKHLGQYLPRLQPVKDELKEPSFEVLRKAIDNYETEMAERANPAVLASRYACLHAHDWTKMSDESPLASARIRKQ